MSLRNSFHPLDSYAGKRLCLLEDPARLEFCVLPIWPGYEGTDHAQLYDQALNILRVSTKRHEESMAGNAALLTMQGVFAQAGLQSSNAGAMHKHVYPPTLRRPTSTGMGE